MENGFLGVWGLGFLRVYRVVYIQNSGQEALTF